MAACRKITDNRRLWSLLDIMLKKVALEFGRAIGDLARLEVSCEASAKTAPNVPVDRSGYLEGLSTQILGNLKRVCILSDLDEVIPEIDRFAGSLQRETVIADVKSRSEHLRHRLCDELENEHYFQVAREDVRFYGQKALFGPNVAAKFKKAALDIENAGNCLALQQPTACVFHLMRAMELAVRTLARRLNMTITPKTTWRGLTGQMDVKINKMPDANVRQKAKKNAWEEARANLHHVGSVWRNNTMHPATSYTPSQAKDVFNAVRVFMAALCEL